jgi:hypothetical protein
MENPALKKQVEEARGVIHSLLRGMKTIGMYRHIETKYGEFLGKAHGALDAFTTAYGSLQFKVELTNFTLFKQELFSEDNPIPYKFFKDGIRQLTFRPGFTLEELVSFTLIALSDPDRGADDLNAQLWRAQMPHFEYIMVEGFRMDEFSEEEVQVEVDKVVDYLQRRLRGNSDDYLRFVRVTEADLEMKLDQIDQMRGVVISGLTAGADIKARVQKDIDEEENQRLFPKLISAVFQVVESGVDDPVLLSDMFAQLLDATLIQEDFAIINQVVLKLRAMEQRTGASSALGQLLRDFVARMSEEQRLTKVGEVLRFSRLKSPQDVVRYLSNVSAESVSILLDVLETIELPENRTLLCDVLVPFAKEHAESFVERLRATDRPQTQRDMVYVLDRSNHPDKLRFFASVLTSPNLALKLDVMAIIAKGRTGEARTMIAGLLYDDTMQVRIQAARVLPEFDREKGFADLLKIVKDKDFDGRKPEEKEALYAALGATGMPGAITYFSQLLQAKGGLFNKQKIASDKQLAIAGLGGACTIQTAKLLQEIADDRSQPPEVTNAAKRQLHRVRGQLFGTAERENE